MTIWYTADTHFSHKKILVYQAKSRPFADVHEMNKAIVERWNAVVRADDIVYHLGDFAFCGKTHMAEIFGMLKGHKHLIAGNHDNSATRGLGWESVNSLVEVHDHNQRITLCHFPMLVWNKSHHHALMFHGHSHGNLPHTRLRIDVGVDCWDCMPVRLEQIVERLHAAPEHVNADHHGENTN